MLLSSVCVRVYVRSLLRLVIRVCYLIEAISYRMQYVIVIMMRACFCILPLRHKSYRSAISDRIIIQFPRACSLTTFASQFSSHVCVSTTYACLSEVL